jgi:hypothetical protein
MPFIILINFIFLMFFHNSIAETSLTCPSLKSVQHSINIWPHGEWLPEYVDNEELASQDDIDHFIATVKRFNRAEWSGDYLEMAHCFYDGNDKIVLARDMLKPNAISDPFWHAVNQKKLWRCQMPSESICSYGGRG